MKQHNMRWQLLVSGFSIAFFAVFSVYLYRTTPSLPAVKAEVAAVPVKAERLTLQDRSPEVRLFGRMVVPSPLSVRTKLQATVARVWVKAGDRVKQGQKLITFETQEAKRRLARAKSDARSITERLKAEETTHAFNVKARKKLKKTQDSELRSLESQVGSLRASEKNIERVLSTQKKILISLEKDLERYTRLKEKKAVAQASWDAKWRGVLAQRARVKELEGSLEQHEFRLLRLEESMLATELSFANRLIQLDTVLTTHANRLTELQQQYQKTSLSIQELEEDLVETQLVAPQNATVSKVAVSQGAEMMPGEVAVQLLPDQGWEVHGQIPSIYLTTLARELEHGRNPKAEVEKESGMAGKQLTLQRVLPRTENGVHTGVFVFDKQTVGRYGFDAMPLTLKLRLPVLKQTYEVQSSALYPGSLLFTVSAEGTLRAVAVEEVGQRWAEDGQLMVLLQSKEALDGVQALSLYMPAAIDGLKVEVVSTQESESKTVLGVEDKPSYA